PVLHGILGIEGRLVMPLIGGLDLEGPTGGFSCVQTSDFGASPPPCIYSRPLTIKQYETVWPRGQGDAMVSGHPSPSASNSAYSFPSPSGAEPSTSLRPVPRDPDQSASEWEGNYPGYRSNGFQYISSEPRPSKVA
ncbi:hypothetical protein IFM89_034890, partial [Coptis chinensis]